MPPLRFVREMACVDRRLERLDVPECENFEPLRADGFAHHPYSRTTTPGTSSPQRDMAPIADTDRLVELLRDLHREGRTERRWDVWFTEYGYETRPPDPFQLYSPAQQARFMGWSTYLAWKTPGDLPLGPPPARRRLGVRPGGRAGGVRRAEPLPQRGSVDRAR